MYRYVLYLRAELIGHFVRTEELYRPLFGNCGSVSIDIRHEILYAAAVADAVSGPYTYTRTRAQYTG